MWKKHINICLPSNAFWLQLFCVVVINLNLTILLMTLNRSKYIEHIVSLRYFQRIWDFSLFKLWYPWRGVWPQKMFDSPLKKLCLKQIIDVDSRRALREGFQKKSLKKVNGRFTLQKILPRLFKNWTTCNIKMNKKKTSSYLAH